MTFTPAEDLLLITPDEDAEETTSSGLVISVTTNKTTRSGVIAAAGPGRYQNSYLLPIGFKAGDRVIWRRDRGMEIIHDGETYIVISASTDVLGTLEGTS